MTTGSLLVVETWSRLRGPRDLRQISWIAFDERWRVPRIRCVICRPIDAKRIVARSVGREVKSSAIGPFRGTGCMDLFDWAFDDAA